MFFSLLQQVVAFICGIIVPRIMLHSYGSEAYGAISSIATFLSYITLIEGGIGAVTRSALYKAFANRSDEEVSAIVSESKRFYRRIAIVFSIYIIVLGLFFKQLSHNTVFSYWYSFGLVIVISLSTFAEYFIGISYSLLLQADQANYINVIFRSITTILNTVVIVFLTSMKCDILTVKLFSSIVFIIRPILLSLYVKNKYSIKNINYKQTFINNKGSAVGQHIAWALHNNTDITVLTIFKDLATVSVYSVNSMIINQLQSIINAFTSGMEAVFGSMYANKEHDKLQKTFGYYETMISILSLTLLSTAAVMIVPFVEIYTKGVSDIKYADTTFSTLLVIATMLYCLRSPYGNMVIAAGRFKETKTAAYGEAVINVTVSILMVLKFGLIGVAIGTILATLFRFTYYAFYLSKHVLYRKSSLWLKRMLTNFVNFFVIYYMGNAIIMHFDLNNYIRWAMAAGTVTLLAGLITVILNLCIYRPDVEAIIRKGTIRNFKCK